MAQLVNLVIYRGDLFNINIRRRYVRLRLVIVIVRYEVLYGAVGKKLLKLAAQLRGQRFIVRNNKRRFLYALDHVSDRIRFARARNAKQYLFFLPLSQATRQAFNCFRLASRRLIGGLQFK
ncbi:hypothetical protein SDC9_111511 [bioreactor metagenome]|uniref:Uncharacterized protein n=1 Tax=bioreactor metagenome TaxID=1076179 RepID=A0A645BS50_9ZZZZ